MSVIEEPEQARRDEECGWAEGRMKISILKGTRELWLHAKWQLNIVLYQGRRVVPWVCRVWVQSHNKSQCKEPAHHPERRQRQASEGNWGILSREMIWPRNISQFSGYTMQKLGYWVYARHWAQHHICKDEFNIVLALRMLRVPGPLDLPTRDQDVDMLRSWYLTLVYSNLCSVFAGGPYLPLTTGSSKRKT